MSLTRPSHELSISHHKLLEASNAYLYLLWYYLLQYNNTLTIISKIKGNRSYYPITATVIELLFTFSKYLQNLYDYFQV